MDTPETSAKLSPPWDEPSRDVETVVIPSNPKALAAQFIHYSLVGGIAFVVDFALLSLVIFLGGHYLLATLVGFLAGLAVSYLLCVLWVWRGTQAKTRRDMMLFSVIGVGGLLLTAALMWLCVDRFSLHPQVAKVLVAAMVLLWNFGLRRAFVFFR